MGKKNKIQEVPMHQHIKVVRGEEEVFGAEHPLTAIHNKTSTQEDHDFTVDAERFAEKGIRLLKRDISTG